MNHVKKQHRGAGRAGRGFAVAALLVSLSGCDILNVENPNNLVEEDLQNRSAASAIVNGALATISRGIASIGAPYSTVSDELMWIGSRDAWNQLNQGHLRDYANEFTDAAFPSLAEGRWMADLAIERVGEFASEAPDDQALQLDLARAYLYGGLIYTAIGEVMDDFAFSDKTEAATPVGPANMDQLFNTAIQYLDQAIATAATLGEDGKVIRGRALSLRARAKHSLAIWQLLNPAGSVSGDGLVSSAGAAADAQQALDVMGTGSDWRWDLQYSAGTVSNDASFQVNERGELQIEQDLVEVAPDDPSEIIGVVLEDPVDDLVDPALSAAVGRFFGQSSFAPLTVTSERLMRLILAEQALASDDEGGFAAHVNAIRSMNGLSDFDGQIDAQELLVHMRRVNLFLMNLRLNDMYRFGVVAPDWQSGSAAVTCTGVELPITIVEVRANPNIGGQAPTCP